jgi:hypothetical protein
LGDGFHDDAFGQEGDTKSGRNNQSSGNKLGKIEFVQNRERRQFKEVVVDKSDLTERPRRMKTEKVHHG